MTSRIGGILGAGAGPEHALRLCSLGCELLPASVPEKISLVALIRQFAVRDRNLPRTLFSMACSRDPCGLQLGFDNARRWPIDAADEEAGDAGDLLTSPPLAANFSSPAT